MGLPITKIKTIYRNINEKIFVIGNPISHSLSPELHNFGLKNNINAVYEKKLEEKELKNLSII